MWSVDFPAPTPPVPLAEEDRFDIILLLLLEHILLKERAVSLSRFDIRENTPTSLCKVMLSTVVQNKKRKAFQANKWNASFLKALKK